MVDETLCLGTDTSDRSIYARELRIGVCNDLRGADVVVSEHVLSQGLLTSMRFEIIERDLFGTTDECRLDRDNPFLDDAAKSRLDEQGMILVETIVNDDDVLASILKDIPFSRQERLNILACKRWRTGPYMCPW